MTESTHKHTPESRVYTEDGQELVIQSMLPDQGVIACPVYTRDNDDEDEYYGGPKYYPRVYHDPPCIKLHERVVRLKQRCDEFAKESSGLELLRKKAAQANSEFEATINRNEQLKTLRLFMDNKITHVVLTNGWSTPKIRSLDEALANKDEWNRNNDKIKLVTLMGKSDGQLDWLINRYSDGSGCNTNAQFFTSIEGAYQCLQDRIDRTPKDEKIGHILKTEEYADIYGLVFPDWMREMCHDSRVGRAQRNVDDLTQKLNKAVAEHGAALGDAATATVEGE